jgi:protein-arginine kinase activator protein McsA
LKEQDKAEIQQRVCRACNSTYKYPVLRSLATRFYCADCMELPERVRAAFELLNKRVKNLTATVEKLEKRLAAVSADTASSPPRPRPAQTS